MTASQLWQICGITGIEIADVFAGLPTHVLKTKADYEELQDLRKHASANSSEQYTTRSSNGFAGVSEPTRAPGLEGAHRDDLATLGKAARKLTPENVAVLIKIAKGLGR